MREMSLAKVAAIRAGNRNVEYDGGSKYDRDVDY